MKDTALLMENVSRRFGAGATEVTAVRDVSLEVRKGEIVLIMGPSGSGKTTLLLMMGALLHPSSGRIQLDGREISSLPEAKLPEIRINHFGFIFQDFNLLSALTARENVEVALNLAGITGREAAEHAADILRQLDLGDRLDFRPAQLSGGEKQRVAIARALANDPSIILADEPTANLDAATGRAVVSRMTSLAREKGKAVVLVTHDPRVTEFADRVLTMEDGALVAGPAREASA